MTDYIEKGHTEKIPKEELEVNDIPVWYLIHHPVTHPLKPNKVRVVYDCAAKFGQTLLNHQLLQGPDQTNQLVCTVIHNGLKPSEWMYVDRDDNPVDDSSKGLKIDAMLKNDCCLKGPKFLWVTRGATGLK